MPASAGPAVTPPATALHRAERLGHRVNGSMLVPGVQRTLKLWRPTDEVPDDYERVDEKVREVDAAVDDAYRKVAGQLRDGKVEQLDGVSDRRFSSWVVALQDTGPSNRKAASTGYIIEDHATAPFANDPMVRLQVTDLLRKSRPDVVVHDPTQGYIGTTGFLDITSTGDAGHIFEKEGNWGKRPYVAESLYPSFDFSNLQQGPIEVDEEAMQKVEEWRMQRAERHWKRVEKAYKSRKERFESGQDMLVGKLERWSKQARLRLRDPEPEIRRTGTFKFRIRTPKLRDEPYDSGRLSRFDRRTLDDMEEYGVRIKSDGDVVRIPFESILDLQGIAYTWEHVQELYALS